MREQSYMIVLPVNVKDLDDPDILLGRLETSDLITIED